MATMLPRGHEDQPDHSSGLEVDGVDVRSVPLRTLRSQMGMIPQDREWEGGCEGRHFEILLTLLFRLTSVDVLGDAPGEH